MAVVCNRGWDLVCAIIMIPWGVLLPDPVVTSSFLMQSSNYRNWNQQFYLPHVPQFSFQFNELLPQNPLQVLVLPRSSY